MAAINHLKNIRGQLATAFGIHLVQGYTVLEEVTTPDATEPEIIVIQALGDGHGAGWDGPQQMTYRAHQIDPSAYHFHAGTFSRGEDDPLQGIDAWFPGGITYNGTTYAVAKLPKGVASEGNATELQGIYRCLKLPNYNAAGQQIDSAGQLVLDGATPEDYFYYSANPARVAAWLILFGRGLKKTRVDWVAWVAWRDYCDELIDWVDGTTTEIETMLEWRSQGGMTVGAGGSAVKGRDTSGVNGWDSGTTTINACPVDASNHRGVQFTINSPGGFIAGLTRATVLSGDGNTYRHLDVGLYFEQGGALKLHAGGGFVGGLSGGWAGGQTYRVVAEGSDWKFYRNGVAINHAYSLPAVPAGALYGGISCNVQNSGVTASSFYPATSGASTQGPRRIPRFEAHIAFTQPTSLQDALDQVCFMACADWQETPRIRFLTPEPAAEEGEALHAAQRTIVHHFDATTAEADNIIKRSISAYPMDVRERWNFVEGIFRDLDHRDLIEDFVTDERAALQDAAGDATPRIISPGQVNLGNMNRSQALRVLKWIMRLRSDRVWFCELRAAADSLHVLPGDVVRVSHETYGWEGKLFLVIDAADDSEGADERSFILQEYDPADYYSDADHTRGQRASAPAIPNPYQPPPAVSAVIEPTVVTQFDGSQACCIRGTVTFAGYAGKQYGRVWWKPAAADDSQWARAGVNLLSPHPETGTDVFEIRSVAPGSYHLKVVSEAANTAQLPFASHTTYTTTFQIKPALLKLAEAPQIRAADKGFGVLAGWIPDPAVPGLALGMRLLADRQLGAGDELLSTLTEAAEGGVTTTALAAVTDTSIFDNVSTVRVTFQNGVPVTVTRDEALSGKNRLIVSSSTGVEVLHYTSWSLVSGSTYELSGFWRGINGTEWAAELGHPSGATVLVFTNAVRFVPLAYEDVRRELLLKAVPFGVEPSSVAPVSFTPQGGSVKPLAIARVDFEEATGRAPRDSEGSILASLWPRTGADSLGDEYDLEPLNDDGTPLVPPAHVPIREGVTLAALLESNGATKFSSVSKNTLSVAAGASPVNVRSLQRIARTGNYVEAGLRIESNGAAILGVIRERKDWRVGSPDLVDYYVKAGYDGFGSHFLEVFDPTGRIYQRQIDAEFVSGVWARRLRITLSGAEVRFAEEWSSPSTPPLVVSPVAPLGFPYRAFGTASPVIAGTAKVEKMVLTTDPFPATILSAAQQALYYGGLKNPMRVRIRQSSGDRRIGYGFPFERFI